MRTLSLLATLVLAASATAAVLARGGGEGALASVAAAEGSFSFSSSRDGMPIFSAAEIAPGDSASGTVEIANTSSEPGELMIEQREVSDTPGVGGALLSSRLTLRITDVTVPAAPATIYSGPLSSMPARPAGVLGAGGVRSYEFVATLPAGGAGQNDVQGASTSVAYRWTARKPAVEAPTETPRTPGSPAPGDKGPQVRAPAVPLGVTLIRAHRKIRRGKLLVWARCDVPCAISARGRLRARASGAHRGAKLRLAARSRYRVGVRRLAIRVPRSLRTWLRRHGHPHLRARLTLRAKDPMDRQAATRRSLRLRSTSVAAARRGPGRSR